MKGDSMVELGFMIAGLVTEGVSALLGLLSFFDFGTLGNTAVSWIQTIFDIATSWL